MTGASVSSLPSLPSVMDTARWVALYRALESERPDALFRDHLAGRLAGERGREISEAMPASIRKNFWMLVVRTRLIDDLVTSSIAEGVDCVVNLAAGFDARPYRLALPKDLTWVEADLPAVVEEKERLLAGEAPACKLVRQSVDLADAGARASFLDRALSSAGPPRRALVITEGLLVYLDPEEVRTLGRELAGHRSVEGWIVEFPSPGLLRILRRTANKRLGNSAQMKFGPEDGVGFFDAAGWVPREVHSVFREAVRLRRLPTTLRIFTSLFPEPNPKKLGRAPWSGVVRLVRK